MFDVIIIGAGISGSFIAHNLSKFNIKVLVLEKDIDVCNGVSKGNSAIIHSGYDPLPNSLKAKLNVLGNKMYEELCNELNVRFKRIGSLTIAANEEQVKVIKELYERAKINGVEVYIKNKKDILEMEPNICEDVILGLYSPTTAIISPWEMVYALLENAIYNGVELKTNSEVIDIKKENDYFTVITKDEIYEGRFIINAAGLYADKIYNMVTETDFKIKPTRGQYYILDKDVKNYVRRIIYPTPTEKGKGVLVVPTIEGNILLGPDAEVLDKENLDTTKAGFTYIRENLQLMMKNIPYNKVIHAFAGNRPKTDKGDFIIQESSKVTNFINVAGIDSPGLASAPAIAEMVENILLANEKFSLKDNYRLYKQNNIRINELSQNDINKYIKKNSKYGNIICRCENITEGEIIDSIHSIIGVKTVDGVKRRCRPGMGRCQGGFCQSLIVDILARELGISKLEVLLNNNNSNLLVEEN